jgi:cell wall-associated NlpC family hydrolase
MSFLLNGINLPRDAADQSSQGDLIDFIHEIKPGDLAFFDNQEERIIHVGIVLSNNQLIHASGKVRIDNLDHQGIYNSDLKRYTHKLRLIRRLI